MTSEPAPVWWSAGSPDDDLAARLAQGRGDRALETLRYDGSRYLRVERHLQRLRVTSEALGWSLPTEGELVRSLARFAQQLEGPGMVRLTFGPDLALTARGLPQVPDNILLWIDREVTHLGSAGRHKTTSRLIYDLLARRARHQGAFEGIFRGAAGELWEGSVTNLFAVLGGELWTAPEELGILPGVVRSQVLERARDTGWNIRLEPLSVDQLDQVSELFLTSSGVELLEVDQVWIPGESSPRRLPSERPIASQLASLIQSE